MNCLYGAPLFMLMHHTAAIRVYIYKCMLDGYSSMYTFNRIFLSQRIYFTASFDEGISLAWERHWTTQVAPSVVWLHICESTKCIFLNMQASLVFNDASWQRILRTYVLQLSAVTKKRKYLLHNLSNFIGTTLTRSQPENKTGTWSQSKTFGITLAMFKLSGSIYMYKQLVSITVKWLWDCLAKARWFVNNDEIAIKLVWLRLLFTIDACENKQACASI